MRKERVEVLLKQSIATLISQKKIADGRIGFVTITAVRVSPDFSTARVYYSHFGPLKDRKKTRDGLKTAAGYIQAQLSKQVYLKKLPKLHFYPDEGLAKGFEVTEALKDLD
ncbi:MAG: 30S ribosome-binding factor RbfA [bacterium]